MSNFDRRKLPGTGPNNTRPDERVMAEARRWADLIAERDLTSREREQFEAWLHDPVHEEELVLALEILDLIAHVPESDRKKLLARAAASITPFPSEK